MPTPFTATASGIVSRTLVQLGLSTVSDVYASTDTTVVQMRDYFVSVGRELVKEYHWSQLQRPCVVTTTAGLPFYPLPPSFDRLVPNTLWDRSNRTPGPGPLSAQDFHHLKAWGQSVSGYVLVRFRAQELELYPDSSTPGGVVFAFEYISLFWVAATGVPTLGVKESPTLNTDVPLFNEELLIAALKRRWRREKGFDTTAADAIYQDLLRKCTAADGPGPTLSLNGRRPSVVLPIDANVPLAGWGT